MSRQREIFIREEGFNVKKTTIREERRNAPRFFAGEHGEIMVFPHGVISYRLLDISETGLSFCYADTENHEWIDSSCMVDLLEKNFSLEGIPAKIVSDLHYMPLKLTENGITPNLRRVGIRFAQLTAGQQQALKSYLVQLCPSAPQ